MATLAIVERDTDGELKVTRLANKGDLINVHPRCNSCGKSKGIHGREGTKMVFCQWVNKPIEREGYCSNHTELE
jgi:hypothetical protein